MEIIKKGGNQYQARLNNNSEWITSDLAGSTLEQFLRLSDEKKNIVFQNYLKAKNNK